MAVADGILQPETRAADERDWPHTSRLLPWLAVAAIATVLVVPIDSMTLPVPLPFDARPDRLLLIACFGLWALIVAVQAPAPTARLRYRFGGLEVLLVLFLCAAVLSVTLNAADLGALGEAKGAFKKLVVLFSYAGFYFFLVGVLRPSEVPAVVKLVVALGTIAAVGTMLQLITGTNLFFTVANALAPPGSVVASGATIVTDAGRPDVTGPARHGLAITCELAMILPFAVVGAVHAARPRDRLFYRIAALLLLIGCATTLRRSGIVLPFLATSAVVLGGGRRMLPLVGVFVALLIAAPIVAPAAVDEIVTQFSAANEATQASNQGRTADYPAIVPDLRARTLLGRGFGTYDPHRYRVLDNELLLLAVEVGFVGLAFFVLLILGCAAKGLSTALSRDGPGAWIGLSVFGSALAFLMANALFDALSFPQAPYTFLLLMALMNVARQGSSADARDAAAAL
jgi:O-antigen ligase